MKKITSFLTALVFILFILGCQAENINSEKSNSLETQDISENEIIDSSNNEETINSDNRDERIVATTVAITEIMDKIELDLVGIPTSYKDLPEHYAEATEVSNPMSPDMELLLSLQPTHVLSVTTLESDLADAFAQHNVPISFLDLTSIDSMFTEISALAEQYNRSEQAETLMNNFNEKITAIEARE